MQPLTVRVIYIVPFDAAPWPEAKRRATEALEDIQHFYADQMREHGYGPKTFAIAYDSNDQVVFDCLPSAHVTEDFLIETPGHNPGYINLCKEATVARLRSSNDIVIYFFEAYSISKTKLCAGSRGMQRGKGGEAFLSSLHLKLAIREWLEFNEGYTERIIPWISSERMWEGALNWEKRGSAMGDVAGAGFGAIAHEFTHCFGTSNHKSDLDLELSSENLMGTGFRRMRGYFRPEEVSGRCILSRRVADLLNVSPFFAVRVLKPKGKHFLQTNT
jgi:hypothetical protein